MAVKLTIGAISIISHDKFSPDDEFMPMLQVINVDQLPYRRIILSDGWDYIVGIFLLNLDELDYSSRLHSGTNVKLTHFVVNKFLKNQNYKSIVINDLEVIVDKCELVVDPVSLHNYVPYSPLAASVVHSIRRNASNTHSNTHLSTHSL